MASFSKEDDLDEDQARRSIFVTNVPANLTYKDVIIHFQKERNGGGEVDSAMYPDPRDYSTVVVTFEDSETVDKTIRRPQQLGGQDVSVQRYLVPRKIPEEVFAVEQQAHEETRCILETEQQAHEDTRSSLETEQQAHEDTRSSLEAEQQAHEDTRRTLAGEHQAHEETRNNLSEAESTIAGLREALEESRNTEHEEESDWILARNEIVMSERIVGKGGWGSVVEGRFRGSVVAVKQIHALILSPHNRRLFEREMNIASRCRHPCLLQFIGATNDDGSPLFLTELLDTNLRTILEERTLEPDEITTIALDVARALNYLHLNRPAPIIHRDLSSANVLLWKRGESWRAKVSDYGTANFMQHATTANPGAVVYSAPEAQTSKQSPKVDVYSYGVLLCEMNIRELPDPSRRNQQVARVTSRSLRDLIRRCLIENPEDRPSMAEIIFVLERHEPERQVTQITTQLTNLDTDSKDLPDSSSAHEKDSSPTGSDSLREEFLTKKCFKLSVCQADISNNHQRRSLQEQASAAVATNSDTRFKDREADQRQAREISESVFQTVPIIMEFISIVPKYKTQLEKIEEDYDVRICQRENGKKIAIRASRNCTKERHEEACETYITLYRKVFDGSMMSKEIMVLYPGHDSMCLGAQEAVDEILQHRPVIIQKTDTKDTWLFYGEKKHVKAAIKEVCKLLNIEHPFKRSKQVDEPERQVTQSTAKQANRDTDSKDLPDSSSAHAHEKGSSPSGSDIFREVFLTKKGFKLSVCQADITEEQVDVIVNYNDEYLRGFASGLPQLIIDKGGRDIADQAEAQVKRRAMKPGEIIVTGAGNLRCSKVMHIITCSQKKSRDVLKNMVKDTCLDCLRKTQTRDLKSIAFPAFKSKVGLPLPHCATAMVNAVEEYMRSNDPKRTAVADIRFVHVDSTAFEVFTQELKKRYGDFVVK